MKDTKKGITLIELIIVIALIGIILIPISNFFFMSHRNLDKVDKEVKLQSEGEKVIGKFVKVGIESCGIESIKKDNEELSTQNIVKNVNRIVLKNSNSSEDEKYDIFELLDNELWYGKGEKDLKVTKSGESIGKNIFCIDIKGDRNLKECDGICIVIYFDYKDAKSTLESKIYFRNRENKE